MTTPQLDDEQPPPYEGDEDASTAQFPGAGSIIRIPIRASELELQDQEHAAIPNPLAPNPEKKHRRSILSLNTPDPDIRFVPMTRAQYAAYWAKDATTHAYLPSVVDPPGGRKAWVQEQLELEAEWKREMRTLDPEYSARKNKKEFAKYTGKWMAGSGLAAVTGPFGVAAVIAGNKIADSRKKKKEAEVEGRRPTL